MTEVYVAKDKIIVCPLGWNEEGRSIENEITLPYETENEEDITSMELARLAQEGGSFDFLSNPQEDIYLIKGVDLVKPVAKTLKQWIDDNFGENAVLKRRLAKILSELKKSNPVIYEKTIHSEQTYTREELEAMAQFIGAVRLPRGFNISKVLDEAENAYYGVL